jgi:cholesterol transport system auxiliary component
MLMPMMVAAIESTGAFPAVVNAPSAARADIELDTEILRLQQDFSSQPSQVRFSLRASLVDSVTRRVLASEQFDAVVDSTSEDARGGVVAAHAAVRNVLTRLAALSSETEVRWRLANDHTLAERKGVRP